MTNINTNINTNLYTTVPADFKCRFKYATYNVDMAIREEKVEETRWMNRESRVKELIDDIDADIISLQEMRSLPNSISVNKWLGTFDKYFYSVEYRNPSELSFEQCILYKPSKFYQDRVVKRWLSDTSNELSDTWAIDSAGTTGFGYIVMGIRFLPVSGGKVTIKISESNSPTNGAFWVFNTHFGLEENLKTRSAKKLVEVTKEIARGEPFIISGDFNFFPDLDGDAQRKIITDSGLIDAGRGAITLTGKEIEGTFVGFDHDNFKADLNNMVSRLDHIFCTKDFDYDQCKLWTKTMLDVEPEELTTRNYPSDHLPLVINFEI